MAAHPHLNREHRRDQEAALAAAQERGWITLDELLRLAAHSPVDVGEASALARQAGIGVTPAADDAPWDDLERLARDGPDAFRPVREGPATADEVNPDNAATLYLREISRTPLLTAEQEVALAKQRDAGVAARERLAQDGASLSPEERARLEADVAAGEAALRHLIEANLRLVVSVARKYMGRGLSFLDLVQEGNIGLQKGAERFSWERGFRFSTYVYWWIRQAVGRAVAEQSRTIRLPGHIFEQLTKLYNTARTLEAELDRSPTPAEIGERMGISAEKVQEALQAARLPISLEKPIGDEASGTLGDLLADATSRAPADEAEEGVLAQTLDDALHQHLTSREARVVRLRFGLDQGGEERTLGEVGKVMGISRERVRQIEALALRKLRHAAPFRRQFADYLE